MPIEDIDIIDISLPGPPFVLPVEMALADIISLVDQFEIDSVEQFLAEFGETVIFVPGAGDEREILAIPLERRKPAAIEGMPRGLAPVSEWLVANDVARGITSDEIDESKDRLKITQRVGEATQDRPILRVLRHDAAWLKLEVR